VVRAVPKPLDVSSDLGEWTCVVDGDRVRFTGSPDDLVVSEIGEGRWSVDRVASGAPRLLASAVSSGEVVWVGIDGFAIEFRVRADTGLPRTATRDQDALSTPMSATVVGVRVRAGDRVEAGDTLLVLEAMKMELPIRAPRAATVRAVHCAEGQLVQPGTPLVELT